MDHVAIFMELIYFLTKHINPIESYKLTLQQIKLLTIIVFNE